MQRTSPTPSSLSSRLATTVTGIVVRGHGVASGNNPASPFPAGTIALQLPHFLARGLDLRSLHPATINVDIAPRTYAISRPAHTFAAVDWTDIHPAETFSFLTCVLSRDGDSEQHLGWIYYPHPETKPMHEQPASVLEVLMPLLDGLAAGDVVTLHLDPTEIRVDRAGR